MSESCKPNEQEHSIVIVRSVGCTKEEAKLGILNSLIEKAKSERDIKCDHLECNGLEGGNCVTTIKPSDWARLENQITYFPIQRKSCPKNIGWLARLTATQPVFASQCMCAPAEQKKSQEEGDFISGLQPYIQMLPLSDEMKYKVEVALGEGKWYDINFKSWALTLMEEQLAGTKLDACEQAAIRRAIDALDKAKDNDSFKRALDELLRLVSNANLDPWAICLSVAAVFFYACLDALLPIDFCIKLFWRLSGIWLGIEDHVSTGLPPQSNGGCRLVWDNKIDFLTCLNDDCKGSCRLVGQRAPDGGIYWHCECRANIPAEEDGRTPAMKSGERGKEWPEPQQCDDIFDQQGKASTKVRDCDHYPPEKELKLVDAAQADARKQANLRCPPRCPAELRQWVSNRTECKDKTLTVYVTGRFKCKEIKR